MKWSLSSLSTYEQCAAKYKYRYIDSMPVPPVQGAAARGIEFHGAIEAYLTGVSDALPVEINFYTQYLTALKACEIKPEHTICLTRTWDLCSGDSPDRWYKGILDLKVTNPARPTEAQVIDWKTGKIYPEHEDQKSIYSLAVFAEDPAVLRVRAIHVYLDLGKNRETIYDRQQMHDMRAKWDSRVLRLESEKEWIPNPSFKCRYCPFSREKGGPCKF